MDDRLTPNIKDEMVEDALRTYPVTPLPGDLTSAVMSQIRQTSMPRFQITLSDLLIASVLTLGLVAAWVGIRFLPPIVFIQLRIQGILFWQSILVNARWLLPTSSIAVGIALAFFAVMSLRPQRRA